jgi:hypothetical protein
MTTTLMTLCPEFFYGPSEPYDASSYYVDAHGRPRSLYSAIMMRLETDDQFVADCDVLLETGGTLPYDTLAIRLVDHARKVDTCTEMSRDTEVWLDEEGDLRVTVW